jgi:hypothetical protein
MRLDLAADEQRREAGEQMDRLRPAELPTTATRVPLSDVLAELRGALGVPVPPSQQGDARLAEGVPDDAASGGHASGDDRCQCYNRHTVHSNSSVLNLKK